MAFISELRVAVICSSNMNRSMEAHALLAATGFYVRSFGTGRNIKIPGPAVDKPNIYQYGVSYEQIYQDLVRKDASLYTQNGLLSTLYRNRKVKSHPERFQNTNEKFDIIITCEERVYDLVIGHMDTKTPTDNSITHIVNIDITDNLHEAAIGAFLIRDMCLLMAQTEDLDNDIEKILNNYEMECRMPLLHSVVFN